MLSCCLLQVWMGTVSTTPACCRALHCRCCHCCNALLLLRLCPAAVGCRATPHRSRKDTDS